MASRREPAASEALPSGYTLVELLVAMGITVSIMGSVLAVMINWQRGFGAAAERTDVQQRLRVAVGMLSADLALAGGGIRDGSGAGGLGSSVASVFPYRQARVADPPGTVRVDAVTVLSAKPGTAAQTRLRSNLTARSGSALIQIDPRCPAGEAACDFAPGMDLVVFDDTGAYDTFLVVSIQPGVLQLLHTMPDSLHEYPAGARLVEGTSRSYWLKADAASGDAQLVRSDGGGADVPVVDHLVSLRFEYFAEPSPPEALGAATDPAGPWTTYGPKPPPLDVRSTAYPQGENCTFAVDMMTARHVPRLDRLGDGSPALVPLQEGQLSDGPWCPDETSPNRYDADLLRIRRIAVTLRVEASLPEWRGPAGVLFARAGASHAVDRWAADQEIRFDVAPPNLNAGR